MWLFFKLTGNAEDLQSQLIQLAGGNAQLIQITGPTGETEFVQINPPGQDSPLIEDKSLLDHVPEHYQEQELCMEKLEDATKVVYIVLAVKGCYSIVVINWYIQ